MKLASLIQRNEWQFEILPVSFVQAEVCGSPEVDLAHLQEVQEASGCGDHDLATVLHVTELGSFGGAAEHAGVLDPG